MQVLSLGLGVVDVTEVVVMAEVLQLNTTVAVNVVHVELDKDDAAVVDVDWPPGQAVRHKDAGGDEDRDINDEDEVENTDVLPDPELSPVAFWNCVCADEKTESMLLGGVKVYGGEEKLEFSEDDLSNELPVEEVCRSCFGRYALLWRCEICHSCWDCSMALSWSKDGDEVFGISTAVSMMKVGEEQSELSEVSDLPGKWWGENVSWCVRESSVTVTFGGPDIVYVTAVEGWCSSQDGGSV
jgi:hypothetical protein